MTLTVITRRLELLTYLSEQRKKNCTIGFVPTMGALHEGHASLISTSAAQNDCTVVSIFVNPKQFGPNEDFAKYPRTFQEDIDIAQKSGAQIVFAPTVEELYPQTFRTQVSVVEISEVLCGAFRPSHFNGVSTVVLILLNLVQANYIYLGQKDYQQIQVIKRMISDLCHFTKVITVPTIRENDGLAMSSRNRYLTEEARKKAASIPKSLAQIAKYFLAGEKSVEKLLKVSLSELNKENLTPQYLEFRIADDISKKCDEIVKIDTVVAIAQIIEFENTSVRLIDNIILGNDSASTNALNSLIVKALG